VGIHAKKSKQERAGSKPFTAVAGCGWNDGAARSHVSDG
jgi:hypothetical protein